MKAALPLLLTLGCAHDWQWEPTPKQRLRVEAERAFERCMKSDGHFDRRLCRERSESWCVTHGLEKDCGQGEYAFARLPMGWR